MFTPAKCRAARALVDMTQPRLAALANLALSTIVDFGRERRAVSDEAVDKIKQALAAAGVELIDENGGGGRGTAG